MNTSNTDEIRGAVRETYGKIAEQGGSCCGGGCGTSAIAGTDAERLGYSAEDANAVPEGANLGLGCGNPQAIAALQPGETVLDLGSGAGFDAFLAARAVGDSGRVIGVDMTHEMLAKARDNATKGRLHQCRIPARRDRASAGGRCQRRRHHLQLRHQPLAGQAAGVPRGLPRAAPRRPTGDQRCRGHAPNCPMRCAAIWLCTPAVWPALRRSMNWKRCCEMQALPISASNRKTPAATSSATGRRAGAWKSMWCRRRSRRSSPSRPLRAVAVHRHRACSPVADTMDDFMHPFNSGVVQ